jgi:hypothetical protein
VRGDIPEVMTCAYNKLLFFLGTTYLNKALDSGQRKDDVTTKNENVTKRKDVSKREDVTSASMSPRKRMSLLDIFQGHQSEKDDANIPHSFNLNVFNYELLGSSLGCNYHWSGLVK